MITTEYERGQRLGAATIHESCFKCGISFAMPEAFYRVKLNDHSKFFCPNGHDQVYCEGKSEVQIEREKREAAEQQSRWNSNRADRIELERQAEARSHAATKGHLTRNRKRIAGGACPCCNRSFGDLARHMASKHPDYAEPRQ